MADDDKPENKLFVLDGKLLLGFIEGIKRSFAARIAPFTKKVEELDSKVTDVSGKVDAALTQQSVGIERQLSEFGRSIDTRLDGQTRTIAEELQAFRREVGVSPLFVPATDEDIQALLKAAEDDPTAPTGT